MLPPWDCVPANFLTAWATDWFSVMDWSHGWVVVPADSMRNYHIYWKVLCYFDSATKWRRACLYNITFHFKSLWLLMKYEMPVFVGNQIANQCWLPALCVSSLVVVKLVITSRSWWCTPLHIFNCWHEPFLCAGWKPAGPQVNPTAGHWAPSNGLVAAGTGHWAASWDTIAEG